MATVLRIKQQLDFYNYRRLPLRSNRVGTISLHGDALRLARSRNSIGISGKGEQRKVNFMDQVAILCNCKS